MSHRIQSGAFEKKKNSAHNYSRPRSCEYIHVLFIFLETYTIGCIYNIVICEE